MNHRAAIFARQAADFVNINDPAATLAGANLIDPSIWAMRNTQESSRVPGFQ